MISEQYPEKYCCEAISKIENYRLAIEDNSQIWDLHHRLEIRGDYINTREELKLMNIYYNRPAAELIFIPHSEHISMHCKYRTKERNPMFGKRGRNSPFYGRYRGENGGMYKKGYLIAGEKNHRYGLFGSKNPCWKADSTNPLTLYNRAIKAYKRGEIDEDELQRYRDMKSEFMRNRSLKSNG